MIYTVWLVLYLWIPCHADAMERNGLILDWMHAWYDYGRRHRTARYRRI